MQGSNNKHKAQKASTLVYKGMRSVEIPCFSTVNSAQDNGQVSPKFWRLFQAWDSMRKKLRKD